MCHQDGLIDVKCVKRANLMTCARPEPTARVFVSNTGPDADAPCFVSPPWHRQWHCRPRLPQSLLLHEQHSHQRGPVWLQPRPMETVAQPVAFRWHPLHPGAAGRGNHEREPGIGRAFGWWGSSGGGVERQPRTDGGPGVTLHCTRLVARDRDALPSCGA